MKPIIQISYLIEDHGESFSKCKGCKTCSEISKLRKQMSNDSDRKIKRILSKGQNMTTKELIYLIDKDVTRETIRKALEMKPKGFIMMMDELHNGAFV